MGKMKFNLDKTYMFPDDIVTVQYKGYDLVISPNNGNWIVLENANQIQIMTYLQNGMSPRTILRYDTNLPMKDVEAVLKEVEGKHFQEKMIPDDSSFVLRLYLTNQCNLRCKHCFMYAADELKNELTTAEIKKLLYDCKKNNCHKVVFTGGEVALKEDLADILKYSKELELQTQILTNGILWTDELVSQCGNYIDEVQISIDGFDEESNARIRGKGAFNKALNAVERFITKTNAFVTVAVTPLYEVIEENEKNYIEFARRLTKKYDNDRFLLMFTRELLDGRNVKADSERNRVMSRIVDEIHESIYPNSKLTTFVMEHEHNRMHTNCGYGGLTVNSNGDIYFCSRIHDVRCYGNIRSMTPDQIFSLREKVRSISSVDHIEPCKNCELRFICGGGCRIANVPEVTQVSLDHQSYEFNRICSQKYKEELYTYMIEANEFLYW